MEATRREFLKKMGFAAAGIVGASVLAGSERLWAVGSAKEKLNFVFILIDDMGWMDLACQGSQFYQTPNIDRLAAQGMRFTNAYASCPVCAPTRASVMTGKYPARLKLTDYASKPKPQSDKKLFGPHI